MSGTTPTLDSLIVIMSSTTLLFSVHHCYKFDKLQCLVPKKKEWFRVLLTWMLLLCEALMLIWGAGFAYLKYKFLWIMLPQYGPVPFPEILYPPEYRAYLTPLTVMMNIAYSLQVALNAEEGLYWYHLMRAVRRPQSASSFLGSKLFYSWIAVSVICTIAQCTIGWIGNPDPYVQIARELVSGGIIELIVLVSASVVVLRFPTFLNDVRTSGAGPDVRARLHFYHELNKVRTFMRILFVASLLALGFDGIGDQRLTFELPLLNDIITMVCLGSFFIVLMISVALYLPRNWGSARGQVLVGNQPPRAVLPNNQANSGFALMSLLREGGQWDDIDDARAGTTIPDSGKKWSLGNKMAEEWDMEKALPSALEHFTSPIAIAGEQPLNRPVEIRVHVERQVHRDE